MSEKTYLLQLLLQSMSPTRSENYKASSSQPALPSSLADPTMRAVNAVRRKSTIGSEKRGLGNCNVRPDLPHRLIWVDEGRLDGGRVVLGLLRVSHARGQGSCRLRAVSFISCVDEMKWSQERRERTCSGTLGRLGRSECIWPSGHLYVSRG